MDVAFLINGYFKGQENVSIDVFDAHTLNGVYQKVMQTMTSHLEIETSVLQALSYCFYEILDNVHIHSGKPLGTAMTRFDAERAMLQVLVADDGMGIRASLAENPMYEDVSEADALTMCLKDSITDGKGMGFGLYATSRLVDRIGIRFVVHSGHHKLVFEDGASRIEKNGLWQGTLIYMEVSTEKDIDPNDVVDNRTDAAEEYNEAFVDTEQLEELWYVRGNADVVFSFGEVATDFGTREMGRRLRDDIRGMMESHGGVVLDFTGVNVVSNSFADECIAKLLLEMPLDELKRKVTFCGLNAVAERCVLVALQRRLRCLHQ